MSFHFHKDRKLYFEHQRLNAHNYVIPFIEKAMPIEEGMTVLEVGCGEGGVLKAFLERGCKGTGVELQENKYERALEGLSEEIAAGQAQIINKNIYDDDFEEMFAGKFDLIVLKDVIEHIPDQPRILERLKTFLTERGQIFFGFPPWYMPFGGHQQIAKSKVFSRMPYTHILPNFMYIGIAKLFGESERIQGNLKNIKTTRISLERFERIVRKTGYKVTAKTLYLINPIYKYKFKLKPRKQVWPLGSIPFFRNFVTTCGFYVIKPKA